MKKVKEAIAAAPVETNRAMHIVFIEALCYNKVKFKYGFGGKDVLDKLEFVIELIYIGGIINARFFRSINKRE